MTFPMLKQDWKLIYRAIQMKVDKTHSSNIWIVGKEIVEDIDDWTQFAICENVAHS